MYRFSVEDMTCGHCVSSVTRAISDLDPQAQVEVSLREKSVLVRSQLGQEQIASVITEAGYTPRSV